MSEETRRQERTPVLQMVVVGAIASAIGIAAGPRDRVVPDCRRSTQAKPIDDLWDLMIYVSVPVFVLVTVIVLFSVWKFHMRPGEENLDGPPIHGNTRLEVIWTAIPAILLVALCSWAYVVHGRHRGGAGQRDAHRRHRPAVRVDLRVPAARRQADQLEHPVPRPGPARALQRQGDRRPARLLGPGVPHEDRRGAGHHDALPRHARPARHLPRRLRGALRPRALGHALDGEGRPAGRVRQVDGRAEGRQRRPPAAEGGEGEGGGEAAAEIDAKTLFAEGNGGGDGLRRLPHARRRRHDGRRRAPTSTSRSRARTRPTSARGSSTPSAEIAAGFQGGIMPKNYGDTLSPEELDALVEYLGKVAGK